MLDKSVRPSSSRAAVFTLLRAFVQGTEPRPARRGAFNDPPEGCRPWPPRRGAVPNPPTGALSSAGEEEPAAEVVANLVKGSEFIPSVNRQPRQRGAANADSIKATVKTLKIHQIIMGCLGSDTELGGFSFQNYVTKNVLNAKNQQNYVTFLRQKKELLYVSYKQLSYS